MNFDYHGIEGFDVSLYQDANSTPQQIDFVKMKNWGADFVIVKVGQHTYPDPDFSYNWSKAREAGLPRSGYWFGDKDSSPESQAQLFWSLVKNDQAEGLYVIDYEEGSWTDWTKLKAFITSFQNMAACPDSKIAIYTGYPYWKDHSPTTTVNRAWFARYHLWLAWYTSNHENVLVPAPWNTIVGQPVLWQDGTPAIGLEVGVESLEIDHNKFNGSAERFMQVMGGQVSVPPTGEIMYYDCVVKSTTTPYANLRQTPDGLDIGNVYPNTAFRADSIERDTSGREWLHSVSQGMIGYIAAWLCDYTPVTTNPPTGEEYILYVKDGVTKKFIPER